jgi:hypothetical protein
MGHTPYPPDSASPGLFKNSAFTGLCGHAPYRNNFTLVKFKGHVKFDHYTLTLGFFCQTVTTYYGCFQNVRLSHFCTSIEFGNM